MTDQPTIMSDGQDYFVQYTTEEGGTWIAEQPYKSFESAKQQAGVLLNSSKAFSVRVLQICHYDSKPPRSVMPK